MKSFIADEVHLNVDVDFYREDFAHGIVAAFRTEIWSHKLPSETKTETTSLRVEAWDSAWQLWKFNRHKNYNRLFGWIHRKWPAKKTAVTHYQAQCTFEIDKRVLFPEANYPTSAGTPYYHVTTTTPVWDWL